MPVRIVVDVREFMSHLPGVLHQQGFEIVPVTLEARDAPSASEQFLRVGPCLKRTCTLSLICLAANLSLQSGGCKGEPQSSAAAIHIVHDSSFE